MKSIMDYNFITNPNQWDSYPSGQGAAVLDFLQNKMKENFKEKVRACSWISSAEYKQLWVEAGADPNSDMVSMDISDKFKENNLHLHRDCGSNIYSLIQDSDSGLKLQDSISFAADSLFCEWAYVVDLDKNTFEVYKGFNKEKLAKEERFSFLNEVCEKEGPDSYGDSFYPIKLIKTYKLAELPTKEQFVKDLSPQDYEE